MGSIIFRVFVGATLLVLNTVANAFSVWMWDGTYYGESRYYVTSWTETPSNPTLENSFFVPWPTVLYKRVLSSSGSSSSSSGGSSSSIINVPVYRLRKVEGYAFIDRNISKVVGQESWQQIDNNPGTIKIVAALKNTSFGSLSPEAVVQLRNDGTVWSKTVSSTTWIKIDTDPRIRDVIVVNGDIVKLHDNGDVWMWIAATVPTTGSWSRIGNNISTKAIGESVGGRLMQLRY